MSGEYDLAFHEVEIGHSYNNFDDVGYDYEVVHREEQLVSLIKQSIRGGNADALERIFDLGVIANGYGLLQYAAKTPDASYDVVEHLIKERAMLDSHVIEDSEVLRSFIYNGRADLLHLVADKFDIDFTADNSSTAVAEALSSVKLSDHERLKVLDTLYEVGFKFPESESGSKFSEIMATYGHDKKVVKHAKKLESKAAGEKWFKRLF